MNLLSSKFLVRGVSVALGAGIAYVAMRITQNEARLVLRELELQDALATNSWREKRRLLRGR